MKALIENWNQIERDFIEWDIQGRFSATQRQILDWFKERFEKQYEGKEYFEREFVEWLIKDVREDEHFVDRLEIMSNGKYNLTFNQVYQYWQSIKRESK